VRFIALLSKETKKDDDFIIRGGNIPVQS
jgi:hypothetical protein